MYIINIFSAYEDKILEWKFGHTLCTRFVLKSYFYYISILKYKIKKKQCVKILAL